jgi:hypothetical protein
MMGGLLHVFGIDTTTGPWYAFWSGAGGILERLLELAVIGGLLWRHNNCHQPQCWRLGRLPVEGSQWKTCRHHHPAPPGRETIRQRYHLYAGSKPGRG